MASHVPFERHRNCNLEQPTAVSDTWFDLHYIRLSCDRKLVSSSADRTGDGCELVKRLARKRGVTASRIRMLKKELLWRLRRKILFLVGSEEFSGLSSKPVAEDWRGSRSGKKVSRRQGRGRRDPRPRCQA